MILLTQSEFSEFNLKSKMKLIRKDGQLLKLKMINDRYKILLYSMYGFYVQCVSDVHTTQITEVDVLVSSNWLQHYDTDDPV